MKYVILGPKNKVIDKIVNPTQADLDRYFDLIKSRSDEKLGNEWLNIVTKSGKRTGNIKLRDLIHKEGDWHYELSLFTYSVENGVPYIHLQLRDKNKAINPRYIDATVGGHVGVFENLDDVVIRETKEEIGLDLNRNKLKYFGKGQTIEKGNDYQNRSVRPTYVCEVSNDLDQYKLEDGEAAGILKIKIDDFIKLLTGEKDKIKDIDIKLITDKNYINTQIALSHDQVSSQRHEFLLKSAAITNYLAKGGEVGTDAYKKPVEFYMEMGR